MNNQVKVAKHPTTGAIITPNKNKPEYGTIRVDSEHISMENGFLNISRRSGFIAGKLADLTKLNYTEGQVIPGKIVRTESFTPQFPGQAPKINPTTKEQVLVNGQLVYFQDKFTANLQANDILISSWGVAKTVAAEVAVVEHTA